MGRRLQPPRASRASDPECDSATFQLTVTPATAPDTGYNLEWASQGGKLYNLRTSTDLDQPIADWELVAGDIEATPDTNLYNVQADGPRRFYAVEEFDTPPPPPLFSENFDAAAALPDGWASNGPSNGTDWEVDNWGGFYIDDVAVTETTTE